MDINQLLKKKIKRMNNKEKKHRKDHSKNEREITFYINLEPKKIFIEDIQQLNKELNQMIFPFYEVIIQQEKKKIYLNNKENIEDFFSLTRYDEIFEDISQRNFLSLNGFNSFHIKDKIYNTFESITPNYKKYFPEKQKDYFYVEKPSNLDRYLIRYLRWQNDNFNTNLPIKVYGPIGSGKSSAILFFHARGKGIINTVDKNEYYFRSSLYINLKYFFNAINDENEKIKVLEDEICCLFLDYDLYQKFIIELIHLGYFNINFSVENGNFFENINLIMDLFVNNYKAKENTENEDVMLILDEYSTKYDEKNKVKNIQDKYIEEKFCILICYQLDTDDDINNFVNDFYISDNLIFKEQLISYFFYSKNYTDFKEELIKDNEFINSFGKNYYFYEKYKNSKKNINEFIADEKLTLSKIFDSKEPVDNLKGYKLFLCGLLLNLNKIKLDDPIKPILKLLPLKYLYLNKIDKEYIKLECFIPLLETLIKENYQKELLLFSKSYNLMDLNPILYGIVFDQIVHYKINCIDDKIFNLKRKAIKTDSIFDGKDILEYTINEYVSSCKKIQNFPTEDNNIVSINQDFNGQKYDECLLIKNNNRIDLIISQTKTGTSFTISSFELLSIPFELLFIKKKIEKLSGLLIDNIYFHFITNMNNEYIEKLCFSKSIDIIYYNTKDEQFYYKKNNKYQIIDKVDILFNNLKKIKLPEEINDTLYSTFCFDFNINPYKKRLREFLKLRKGQIIEMKAVLLFHNLFNSIKINKNEFIFIHSYYNKKYGDYIYNYKNEIFDLNDNHQVTEYQLKDIMCKTQSFFIIQIYVR